MIFAFSFFLTCVVGLSVRHWSDRNKIPPIPRELPKNISERKQPPLIETYYIKQNSNLYETLSSAGLENSLIHSIIESLKPLIDLSRLAKETPVVLKKSPEEGLLTQVEVTISKIKSLLLRKDPNQSDWIASWKEKTITIEPAALQGTIQSSFWDSALEQDIPPQMVTKLADIFASQLDFDRHIHPGDSWRLVVEKKHADGEFLGYGDILAAFYWVNNELHSAIGFQETPQNLSYYNLNGESLAGSFLKSPLNYIRISSKFQRERYHPVLGVNRPHNGVDYAAPTGTPVRAVAEGRIDFLGRQGGSGKMIRIKHKGPYKTAYKHLSKYVTSLKKGDRVQQGQIIGFVGMTGLATGPHLHFEFYENDQYRDPLGMKFSTKITLSGKKKKDFQEQAKKYIKLLDDEENGGPKWNRTTI